MKTRITLLFFILVFSGYTYSQRYQKLEDIPTLNRGTVTFADGFKAKFRFLNTTEDSVYFINGNMEDVAYHKEQVIRIVKVTTMAYESFIYGGLIGLGTSALTIATTPEFPSEAAVPMIGGVTALMAMTGAIVGVFFEKEILMYKKDVGFSFRPTMMFNKGSLPAPGLTFSINLK